jgi:hypothetical protein
MQHVQQYRTSNRSWHERHPSYNSGLSFIADRPDEVKVPRSPRCFFWDPCLCSLLFCCALK